MINTNEEILIKGLTENFYSNGLKNYICITNNPTSSYNQSYYDIYCYYSENEITKSNNVYTISNGKKCDIDTKSITSQNKLDSITCNTFSGTVSANTKEFVYSNINGESNIIGDYMLLCDLKIGTIIISIIILVGLIYKLLKSIIK